MLVATTAEKGDGRVVALHVGRRMVAAWEVQPRRNGRDAVDVTCSTLDHDAHFAFIQESSSSRKNVNASGPLKIDFIGNAAACRWRKGPAAVAGRSDELAAVHIGSPDARPSSCAIPCASSADMFCLSDNSQWLLWLVR